MKTVEIPAIENGTVIDHLTPRSVPAVMEMLQLLDSDRVSIGINVPSPSLGSKAFIKVHDRILTPDETNQLAILCPTATVSRIRDFEVVSKGPVEVPETIRHFPKCPNPRCVTNHEAVETRFTVKQRKDGLQLRCHYCEKMTDAP